MDRIDEKNKLRDCMNMLSRDRGVKLSIFIKQADIDHSAVSRWLSGERGINNYNYLRLYELVKQYVEEGKKLSI